ncbi:nuclear receptor subfamily 2 group C member 1 isoform X3 [Protopterus annectens]|uniref:nuclear receptor subfamily 2 group C member 1 isoform X3 n=1 Tax=Protopterus annectens TaxID=7888 RepID=UPI001CF96FC3|nr:nuclear receptor subfamily 2 group C member 1 isoform X3 [Protopterus annectens]
MEEMTHQIIEQQMGELRAVTQTAVIDGTSQRIQFLPADSALAVAQRIQIVTDQQTGQKYQIVTAVNQASAGKQYIVTNADGTSSGKLILTRQDQPQGKVILATPDAAGVNQLIFATPDVSAQQIQIVADPSEDQTSGKTPAETCVVCGDRASAVQCERKPIEVSREKSSNCAASTEKIYIRKDLRSPLAATPTFVTEKEVARSPGLLDPAMLLNIQQSLSRDSTMVMTIDKAEACQGDLSTLANVVTSLANLSKSKDIVQEVSQDLAQSNTELSVIETLNNGDTSLLELKDDQSSSDISRAFDTLAKAVHPSETTVCPSSPAESRNSSSQLDSGEMTLNFVELEGPLLSDAHIAFRLTMPSPVPEYLNVHYICESASRLLFLSMHWARSIPAFQTLTQNSGITLVKACWNELFTLGLAQCSNVMNVGTILTAIVDHLHSSLEQEKLTADKVKLVMDHIFKLQEFCNSMNRLSLDGCEYAYLKAIVLFSPDHLGLENVVQIERYQERAYMEFQDYVTKTYPEDTYRVSRLLVRLPALRLLNACITEELFFTGLIGNVQIDSIIPYILKMETTDYTTQVIN